MRIIPTTHRIGLVGLLVVVSLTACTKEKKVFVERPFFDDPPTAAQGFLGFDDKDQKLTVCGNCHVGQQTRWHETAHADAWKTLQDSGHSQAFCEDCHSAGPLGNATVGSVGYAGVKDTRYHDVQCESCHGPGLDHVSNPDDAAAPQASIAILDGDAATKNCAECHQGAHHPFADEWVQSRHAHVNDHVVERYVTTPTADQSCLACHSGQGVLKAWGVSSDYAEKGATPANHVGITCAVCHDPHAKENDKQLRFPIDVPDEQNNLCMKCHQRRSNPDVTAASVRGPHSPEGPLLLGEAGWWPPGFTPQIDRIVATHGTTGNPKMCASCHVSRFTVTDPATGNFVFQATGHLFEAIPCLGPDGKPVPNGECDLGQRTFKACANSGCHGSEASAKAAFTTANARIAALVAEVDRLLPLVPAGEYNLTDGRFTVADGAWFNKELCKRAGSPTHNPYLTEQLMIASISALKTTYGIQASELVSLDRMFK